MKRHKVGKHVIFKRFLISYILILIIPITIGSYAYFQAMSLIENNIIISENHLIAQTGDIVDKYLSSIDLSVFMLSSNTAVQNVLNLNQPAFGSDKVYQLIKVIKDMKSSNISGALESTTFIFLQKADVVINSNYANYGIQNFYENSMKYEGISYQEWYQQVFETKNDKTIWPSHKITEKRLGYSDYSYDAITYIQSIPGGAIIVQLDTQKVRNLLHNTVIDHNGYAFIIDENDNIYAKSDDADVPESFSLKTLSMEDFPQNMVINGTDTLVFSVRSGYNNWYYVCLIPTNGSLMDEVRHIKQTAIIDVIVILIVGCLISIFFSRTEVKPINEILSSLAKVLPSQRRYKDEYSLIKDNINSLINKNNDMSESLYALKNVLISQLLNGNISNIQEVRIALANLDINLEGHQYAVIVATIKRNVKVKSLDVNTIMEENIINRIADNILVRNMNGNGCTYLINPQQIAVILCFESVNSETCREEIRTYIDTINDELSNSYNIEFDFGIGNIYNNLQDVNFSFSEAKVALQNLDFEENPERIVWYSDIPISQCYYFFPLDLERTLVSMVISGNIEDLNRTLQHIHRKNFIERHLPYPMQLQLFYEMKATLLKICNETNIDEAMSGIKALKMWDTFSEDCMREISQAFLNLSNQINSSKKSHNKKMLNQIIDYLHANFSNPNISLYSVSSEYKISASYLSQFFKEQTGRNFSDYLEEQRILEACRLLCNHNLTVEEIAGRVGYNNAYSFRRAFKRHGGKLPNEYRNSI